MNITGGSAEQDCPAACDDSGSYDQVQQDDREMSTYITPVKHQSQLYGHKNSNI